MTELASERANSPVGELMTQFSTRHLLRFLPNLEWREVIWERLGAVGGLGQLVAGENDVSMQANTIEA